MDHQTIAAISTPLGPGGIGIIRISGPEAYPILEKLFVRTGQTKRSGIDATEKTAYESHRVYYGKIVDPTQRSVIDEVLALYMKAPNSFTREDVVEIQSHSGFVVLDRLLNTILDNGARLSEPGEFTKRAFLNGRIDLTQAEAIIDLINAPCDAAVQMANRQMAGNMKREVENIVSKLTNLRAKMEVELEFGETDVCDVGSEPFAETIQKRILAPIEKLIQVYKETAIFRDGIHLAIGGVPNVGKSSLLNQLVQKETAIVSEVPGTTRDLIREYISINGIPVVVFDTAGLHDSDDPIESMGIQKAREQIESSDILLFVVDASRQLTVNEEKLIDKFKKMKTLFLINKIDIAGEDAIEKVKQKIDHRNVLAISAKTGQGIETLKERLFKGIVTADEVLQSDQAVPNLRQRKILEKAYNEIQGCLEAIAAHQTSDIVSQMLNNAILALSEITGLRTDEDLYDQIFSQFCIGK